MFIVALVAAGFGGAGAVLRGHNQAELLSDMRPEIVSKLLSEVEHRWETNFVSLLRNNNTGEAKVLSDMESSCFKVANSVVQGSDGDEERVVEYMRAVCSASKAEDAQMCQQFAKGVEDAMIGDSEFNRERLDLKKFCQSFWTSSVQEAAKARKQKEDEEEAAAAKEKAEEEKASAEKKAADEKAAAEKKAADEKAAAEKAAADKKAAEEKAATDKVAADEKAAKMKQEADQIASQAKAEAEKVRAKEKAMEEEKAIEEKKAKEEAEKKKAELQKQAADANIKKEEAQEQSEEKAAEKETQVAEKETKQAESESNAESNLVDAKVNSTVSFAHQLVDRARMAMELAHKKDAVAQQQQKVNRTQKANMTRVATANATLPKVLVVSNTTRATRSKLARVFDHSSFQKVHVLAAEDKAKDEAESDKLENRPEELSAVSDMVAKDVAKASRK